MAKYVGFKQGMVHESHVISEYYCGGCGYPVTDHDSFCPECGGAFRECDASNLEAENAKLRELCADFVRQINSAEYFDCFGGNCEKWGECRERHGDCVLEDHARELGIEVGE